MKKLAVGILSGALILGAGTAVFAAGNNDSSDGISFEKMLPFMQKMHPDISKEDLQQMYKACHGDGGMMNGTNKNTTDSKNMMNNL
ncbi:CUE domain-containing protein [Neobacillus mesonae]|uniref:CUE domain-containing protein n=1 Tax=Neobacillus mesonae TaxID=1193713 RepID=UPI00203EC326|nr:CUE domain-containing protein [Neobacillus mesonae]MCM3571304.1 CUE domain-containing protein [Neobacillus mesonae]